MCRKPIVMHSIQHLVHVVSTALLALIVFVSCGGSEYEYSNHRAYFVFDNQQHLNPALTSAMNAMVPGIFCRISVLNGARLDFTTNQGMSESSDLTAYELQRTIILGAYNGSGIIVGFGSLNNPPTFYAYDAQCPNCYEENGMPRYQLTMSTIGQASCKQCGRSYDMNNDGIVCVGIDGKKLIRYRATTTGPTGVLSVNN